VRLAAAAVTVLGRAAWSRTHDAVESVAPRLPARAA
jgi:hypothetical protein